MPKTRKDFKFNSSFATTLRCPVSKDTSKFLAKASIDELKTILPTIAQENGWDDLLPIAGNACVVNFANKNRDAINTAAAVAIAPYFADKFINAEHDRSFVIGFLKNHSFSKFDPNYMVGAGSEPLTVEEASAMTDPFNLALGGVIWRVIAPAVAEKIEECNTPGSPDWLSLAISWELGFDSHAIAVGPQNLSECKIISDPTEVEAMSKYLVQSVDKDGNAGPGQLEDGTPIYRLITESSGAVPLGIGLTFAPAAAVMGVVTPEFEAKAREIKEKLSQSETPPVITTKANTAPTPSMKTLTSLKEVNELNDANKAEYSLANLKQLILAETTPTIDLDKTVREYQEKLNAEKTAKEEAERKAGIDAAKAASDIETLKKQNDNLKVQFDELAKKQAEAEATTKFNERMGSLDETYELDDAMRKSVAEDIRGLSDEEFEKWVNRFGNYASKNKKTVADPTDATDKSKTDEALAKTKKEAKASTLPNQPTEEAKSLLERMRAGFTGDNGVKIVTTSPRRK